MNAAPDPADQAIHAQMVRAFARAAICGRSIGVAALAIGALAALSLHELPIDTPMPAKAILLLIILLFSIPGFLYLLLSTWVGRQRVWPARIMLVLAMADMMLLGVIFITAWGGRQAIFICSVAGLFVISLGMLTLFSDEDSNAANACKCPAH